MLRQVPTGSSISMPKKGALLWTAEPSVVTSAQQQLKRLFPDLDFREEAVCPLEIAFVSRDRSKSAQRNLRNSPSVITWGAPVKLGLKRSSRPARPGAQFSQRIRPPHLHLRSSPARILNSERGDRLPHRLARLGRRAPPTTGAQAQAPTVTRPTERTFPPAPLRALTPPQTRSALQVSTWTPTPASTTCGRESTTRRPGASYRSIPKKAETGESDLSSYLYAEDDPTLLTDPSGLDPRFGSATLNCKKNTLLCSFIYGTGYKDGCKGRRVRKALVTLAGRGINLNYIYAAAIGKGWVVDSPDGS